MGFVSGSFGVPSRRLAAMRGEHDRFDEPDPPALRFRTTDHALDFARHGRQDRDNGVGSHFSVRIQFEQNQCITLSRLVENVHLT